MSEVTSLEERYVMQTYKRAPVEFVLGEGVTLYDRDGEALREPALPRPGP